MPRPGIIATTIRDTQSQALNVAIAISITMVSGQIVNAWSGVGAAPILTAATVSPMSEASG